uniref:Uncharacterized protein n=1 Tax=Eutreptiella gymnastica TaxID=73025 RepID=A0A7S1JG41_9EUGL|mmetsp:Transcript_93657/g.162175  ORF Transcript_93657/g.162175 Transcript_93657/m.162175 type:complete len:117 (+) Transcript_93657:200-550(+)
MGIIRLPADRGWQPSNPQQHKNQEKLTSVQSCSIVFRTIKMHASCPETCTTHLPKIFLLDLHASHRRTEQLQSLQPFVNTIANSVCTGYKPLKKHHSFVDTNCSKHWEAAEGISHH